MPRIPRSDPENRADIYIVADLRVDVGRQCVSRGHADIALPNLSFQLLVALIQSAPNVLSNDRLMELVWPGQVVSPETVNKRVKLLRDALSDDVREPRYIAGVRSRGTGSLPPCKLHRPQKSPRPRVKSIRLTRRNRRPFRRCPATGDGAVVWLAGVDVWGLRARIVWVWRIALRCAIQVRLPSRKSRWRSCHLKS